MSHKPLLRRGLALSSFALTLGLLALAGPSCGPVVTAGDCPDGFTDCDGTCANLETSESHCGACDSACADGVACSNGACEGSAACPPGLIDCGGACVDPGVHPSHCGACFNACTPDAVCSEGACVDDGCAPGLVSCSGFCTDIYYDPNNCGGCGLSCGLGAACDGGVCTTVACPPGLTYCGGVCVDLASSPEHCGACFAGCGFDETCSGGACVGCSGSGGVCGACDIQDLGAQVPQTVSGDTTNRPNVLVPTCVPSQSGESGHLFTAPAADTYVFDTLSSMYDTVLHVRDLACGELACNDDAAGSVGSQVLVPLAAGQQVLVVVDGFGIEEGPYTLHINTAGGPPPPPPPVDCPDEDLGSTVPQTITGSTAGADDDTAPACGPAGGADLAFSFTAPASGNYTFDTFGSTYDTVLHLRSGATCSGAALACNDDAAGSLQSRITIALGAGQTVIAVVDGFGPISGDFELNIQAN